MNQTKNESITEIYQAQKHLLDVTYSHWIDTVLFSFNWWFLMFLGLIPWFLWWKLVNKKRLLEILSLGLLVMITAFFLDSIGISFLFWTYKYKVVQMLPPLNPIDLTAMPILYMLVYQWFPKWKSFVVVHIVVAFLGACLVEPLFVHMKIYSLHTWKSVYSIPIYFAIGVSTKWLIQKIMNLQR
jgi:hypothetical protein